MFPVALAFTVTVLVSLLTWQFANTPLLQRSTIAQRANADIQQVVNQNPLVDLVEANVRFTGNNIKGQNTLLSIVYVQPRKGVSVSSEEISSRLTQDIQTHLQKQNFNITPLVNVNVINPDFQKKANSPLLHSLSVFLYQK